MCASNDKKNEALQKLQQILEEALDIGADYVALQYMGDGLDGMLHAWRRWYRNSTC